MSTEPGMRNPAVDAYIDKAERWREALEELRTILLECGLSEEIKWDQLCFTWEDRNVLLIHELKQSCVLAFLKGALLEDAGGLLVKPGANTQSGRWMKFASAREVVARKDVLEAYVHEAIEVEKAGLEVRYKETSEFAVPEELARKWADTPTLKAAFEALTPGRQRGYLLHFAAPKQSKTRAARIEKWTPRILEGKGLHDY